jgi:endonuclease-3
MKIPTKVGTTSEKNPTKVGTPNRLDEKRVARMLGRVEAWDREQPSPYVSAEARAGRSPFRVLVSCLISLRTQERVTAAASSRLFALADSPESMRTLGEEQIAKAIYPAGYYNTKAKTIRAISKILSDQYESRVPDTIDALLDLPGVGRKTANLVVTMAYGKPGICVDTHVHRITNRWGWVATKTPEKTEMALRETLPQRFWISLNHLLVIFGQTCCTPLSPKCSLCPVLKDCLQIGVTKHR